VVVVKSGNFAFLFPCHSDRLAPILVGERPGLFLISDFQFLISSFRPPDLFPAYENYYKRILAES